MPKEDHLRCLEMGSSTEPGPPPIVVALSMPATIALYSRSSCCALSRRTRASSSGLRGGSTGLGSTTSHSDSSSWNRRPASPFSLLGGSSIDSRKSHPKTTWVKVALFCSLTSLF